MDNVGPALTLASVVFGPVIIAGTSIAFVGALQPKTAKRVGFLVMILGALQATSYAPPFGYLYLILASEFSHFLLGLLPLASAVVTIVLGLRIYQRGRDAQLENEAR